MKTRRPSILCLIPLLLADLTVTALAASPATGFRVLFDFPARSSPRGVVAVDGAKVFGTTEGPQNANAGTIYSFDTSTGEHRVLRQLSSPDGHSPRGGLIRSGTTLFGTGFYGGAFGGGTVFRIETDGSGFQVLHHFNPSIGGGDEPTGSEGLLLVGSALYGMTHGTGSSNGVAFGWGTVFRLETNGSGFAILKNFPGGVESIPWAGLCTDGASLFGTTSGFATDNRGAVFRIDLDGSNYSLLKTFTGGGDASFPLGGLARAGNALFGTTYYGPNSQYQGSGTVFGVNSDGTGFKTVKVFGPPAWWPREGIILAEGVLYGSLIYSASTLGAIYALSTNGSTYSIQKQFSGPDGSYAEGLTLVGRTLYGVSPGGGKATGGALFSLPLVTPGILSGPATQTSEVGGGVHFSVRAQGMEPFVYRWYFNETNLLQNGSKPDLVLTNVQSVQGGTYRVVVSNAFGSAGASAELGVISSVPRTNIPALGLQGLTGTTLNVEACDSLTLPLFWVALDAVTLTNSFQYFLDSTAGSAPRSYRTWHTNADVPPTANTLQMVPAIPLTGPIGTRVRLEYINQFGPLTNWFVLQETVVQAPPAIYYDFSSLGQPPRLYRLVHL